MVTYVSSALGAHYAADRTQPGQALVQGGVRRDEMLTTELVPFSRMARVA